MTFANVCANREQLTLLSQLLLAVFPGCVIHQSSNPSRTLMHLSTKKLDAVFVDADSHSEVLQLLNTHQSKASVYLMCRQGVAPPEETDGIRSVIMHPFTRQKIHAALQTIQPEIREVI